MIDTASTRSEQETRQQALLRDADDGLVLLDRFGEAVEVSPSYSRILGYSPEQRLEMRTRDLVHPNDLDRWREAWRRCLAAPGARVALVLRTRHNDGRWCPTEVTFRNGLEDPSSGWVVATISELDRENAYEAEHYARRRLLEELPQRREFTARIAEAVGRLPPDSRSQVVVLVVKLDQYRAVARACGRGFAAQMFVAATQRLRSDLRAGDDLGVVDYDCLAVACETRAGRLAASALAERVTACFAEPFLVDGDRVVLTVSIGIAFATSPSVLPALLIEDAELAMGVASSSGGNRLRFFSASERTDALNRVVLPAALLQALSDNEFVVHYQPVVDLVTGRPVGAEALVRWAQPTGSLAAPDAFIGAAESSGVIVALGGWVLREACHVATSWPVGVAGPLSVAINVSALQLEDPHLPTLVGRALSASGLQAHRLTLEVTESALLSDPDAAVRRLWSLRELGVRVALDDFGTGYSSLAYLKRLPVNALKIDRSFVTGVGLDATNAAIVTTVVTLGLALGLDVIAEGVEAESEAVALRRVGCPHAQGYLFCRPISGPELGSYLGCRLATGTGDRSGDVL